MLYDPSAISVIGITQSDASLPSGGGTARFTDRRLEGRPVGDVRSDTVAVLVGQREVNVQAARDPGNFIIPVEYTLIPGTGVEIIAETANLALRATWFWRERAQLQED